MSGDDDGSWHNQQPVILAAAVAGGIPPVVGHVVDVYNEADVEHELHGAECANQ